MAHKYLSVSSQSVSAIVEHTLGCRWMLPLLEALRAGINRPNSLQKILQHNGGRISAKVLNERLDELLHFGIIERHVMAITPNQTPSHVEYHFTAFGEQFLIIVDAMKQAQIWINEHPR